MNSATRCTEQRTGQVQGDETETLSGACWGSYAAFDTDSPLIASVTGKEKSPEHCCTGLKSTQGRWRRQPVGCWSVQPVDLLGLHEAYGDDHRDGSKTQKGREHQDSWLVTMGLV